MTKRWLALLLGCLALALVAAGCGGDDDDNGGGGGGGGGGGQQEAPAATSGGAQVSMKDIKFNPSTVKVKVGDTVTWTNDDSVGHDVTKKSGPGPKFSSGPSGGMQKGDTFQQKFTTPGTINYVCTVHPNMKATITVK
jgi:amicyanin